MDYKNTPEGRAVQSKYADLLSLSRPAPIKSRMTIQNRAKIFSPFAALRGYEDEIASEGKDQLPANCESRLAQRLLLAKTYRPSSRLVIYLL